MSKPPSKTSPAKPKSRRSGTVRRPRGTGATYVYESLKAKILNLELKPGTLLDETELSREFHLSRSPVRESLIRLSAEGLVDTPRNRTSMVSQFDFATLPSYFDAMQLLYRLSGRLAALNRKPAQVEKLKDIERKLEQAHTDSNVLGIVSLNRDFHALIAEMSGNQFITTWMRGLLDQGQRVFRMYLHHFQDRVPLPKLSNHLAMIAAIEKGDIDGAERASKADADTLIDEVVKILGQLPTSAFSLEATGNRK